MKRLVAASWAPTTQASYNTVIKKWHQFCATEKVDSKNPTFQSGMSFLIWLHDVKMDKYRSIALARSALSALIPLRNGCTFGKDPMVSKVLKGMFMERPVMPKKVAIYDMAVVIDHMIQLPHNEDLILEMLTKKLVTLLCFLSGQRSQSISYLFEEHMLLDDTSASFYIPKRLKTTTPTFHQEPLEFDSFPDNRKVCVIDCLKCYLNRTEGIRDSVKEEGGKISLILSYEHPHRPVKSATLARYVKTFLGWAGIDITVFTAHSTRAASSSKANNLGLSLKDIAKAGGWKRPSTFQKFYNFPIRKNFGTEILKSVLEK